MGRLGPHRFPVLIDTGAARSLIVPTTASGFRFRLIGSDRVIGVNGRVSAVQIVELDNVGLAEVDLPPFRAGVLELSHLRLGIQGVLGVNAFPNRRLQIDFSEGRVYLLS